MCLGLSKMGTRTTIALGSFGHPRGVYIVFLYLWISSVYSVITQVYQPNVNPRSELVTIGEAGDFSNSASSSSQKQRPHGETRDKMPSPANDGTRASNASDNWDEQGASRCAACRTGAI